MDSEQSQPASFQLNGSSPRTIQKLRQNAGPCPIRPKRMRGILSAARLTIEPLSYPCFFLRLVKTNTCAKIKQHHHPVESCRRYRSRLPRELTFELQVHLLQLLKQKGLPLRSWGWPRLQLRICVLRLLQLSCHL